MCVGAHFANLSSSNTLTFSGYAALPQNFTQMGQALAGCGSPTSEFSDLQQNNILFLLIFLFFSKFHYRAYAQLRSNMAGLAS